jgi:hypothetical protein
MNNYASTPYEKTSKKSLKNFQKSENDPSEGPRVTLTPLEVGLLPP